MHKKSVTYLDIMIIYFTEIINFILSVWRLSSLDKIHFDNHYKNNAYGENAAQGDATLAGARYGLYARENITLPDTGVGKYIVIITLLAAGVVVSYVQIKKLKGIK